MCTRPQKFSWKVLLGIRLMTVSYGFSLTQITLGNLPNRHLDDHALRAEGIPMLALMEQLGIFKKLAQKAGVKAKPGTPEPEDPVFTRIDKEIDEIR